MTNWTKEEIGYLQENYPFTKNEILIKNLNHSITSIITKANRDFNLKKFKICIYCGTSVNDFANNSIVCNNCRAEHIKNRKKEYYIKNRKELMGKKLWTKEELEYLKKNYSTTQNKILKQNINRPVSSIIREANHHLKLRKIKYCKTCGVDITNLAHNAIVCKSCFSNYNKNYKRSWRIKNKERLIKKRVEWNLKNIERKREMGRLWRLNNKERKKLDDRLYYQKMKALGKIYYNRKNSSPDPSCIACDKILLGRNYNTKWCLECGKKQRLNYTRDLRKKRPEHYRELARKYVKVKRDKENQRRIKLGLPLIGNNFKKEQELFFYIKNFFPDEKIIYHDRAALGNGWELDIFIPELNLAFEYYGRQHFDFKSTGYWKNYEEFEAQKLRDELKRVLCKINKITLIEFYYYEKLSEKLILTRLQEQKIIVNQTKLIDYSITPKIEIKMGNQRRY